MGFGRGKRWRPPSAGKKRRGRSAPLPPVKVGRIGWIGTLEGLWWQLTRGKVRPRLTLRLEARLYDRSRRTYRRVPGWKLELEVGRMADVRGALVAAWRGLQLWADGLWHHGHQRPQCPECGEVLGIGRVEQQFVPPVLRLEEGVDHGRTD